MWGGVGYLRQRGERGEHLRALLQVEPEARAPQENIREAEHQRDVQHHQVGLVGQSAVAVLRGARDRPRRACRHDRLLVRSALHLKACEHAVRLAVEAHVVHRHGPNCGRHEPEEHQQSRDYQVLQRSTRREKRE